MQLALLPPRVRVRTSARCRARHRAHLSEPSATAPGHVEPPCRSCRAISSECFVKLPALVFSCDCCHTPGDDVPLGGRPPPRVPCAGATPAWDGSAAATSDGPSRRRCRRGRRKRFRDPGPDAPVPGISASPSSPRTDADTAPSVSAPTGPDRARCFRAGATAVRQLRRGTDACTRRPEQASRSRLPHRPHRWSRRSRLPHRPHPGVERARPPGGRLHP